MQNVCVLMNAGKIKNLADLWNKLNITHYTIPQQDSTSQAPTQIYITNENQVTNNIQNNNSTSYAGSNTHHGVTKYTQGEAPVTVLDRDNELAKRLKYELEKRNGFNFAAHPEIKIQSLSDGSINIRNECYNLKFNMANLDKNFCDNLIECIKRSNIDAFKKMALTYKGSEQYGYKTVHTGMQIKGQKDRCCPGQCNIF